MGGLFGGSQPQVVYAAAPAVEQAPVRAAESEAESVAVRDEQRRKIAQLQGSQAGILTSPLGVMTTAPTSATVLGRI